MVRTTLGSDVTLNNGRCPPPRCSRHPDCRVSYVAHSRHTWLRGLTADGAPVYVNIPSHIQMPKSPYALLWNGVEKMKNRTSV